MTRKKDEKEYLENTLDLSEDDILLPPKKQAKFPTATRLKNLIFSKVPSLHDGVKYTKFENESTVAENHGDEQFSISENELEGIEECRSDLYIGQSLPASLDMKVKLLQTITSSVAWVFFVGGALFLIATTFMVIPMFVVPFKGALHYMIICATVSIVLMIIAIIISELNWSEDGVKIKCTLSCFQKQYRLQELRQLQQTDI